MPSMTLPNYLGFHHCHRTLFVDTHSLSNNNFLSSTDARGMDMHNRIQWQSWAWICSLWLWFFMYVIESMWDIHTLATTPFLCWWQCMDVHMDSMAAMSLAFAAVLVFISCGSHKWYKLKEHKHIEAEANLLLKCLWCKFYYIWAGQQGFFTFD
jgi:hypothetical protein